MKKFLVFISFLVNVALIGGIIFFTLTPTGKKMLKDYVAKVDTVETVDNTDDTTDTTEPEKNIWGLTKEASIADLKITYTNYQGAIEINNFRYANLFAGSYFALVEDSKKTWKDFASLMKTEGLPETLPTIETN